MPSQSYRITEPHPSVPASHYLPSGRGGIGNMTHINTKGQPSSKPASRPASNAAQMTTTTMTSQSNSRLPTSLSASASASASAAGTATTTTTTITTAAGGRPSSYYAAGRGGAGNMHQASYASERPIFSFDEELERQRRMMQNIAPVYHIGRGGAGNYASGSEAGSLSRRSSAGSDSSA